jgi:cell division protein FtsI/penicillin-binding protein 2
MRWCSIIRIFLSLYPDGDLASIIIGFYPYLNPASGASFGIETILRRYFSGETIQKNSSLIPMFRKAFRSAKGASIALTIDRKVQKLVKSS